MNDQLERDIRNLFCNTGKFISRDELTDILVGLIERIQHLEQLRPEQEPETRSRRRFEFEFSLLDPETEVASRAIEAKLKENLLREVWDEYKAKLKAESKADDLDMDGRC